MGTKNSSEETKSRAEKVSKEVGATHYHVVIDDIITAFDSLVSTVRVVIIIHCLGEG